MAKSEVIDDLENGAVNSQCPYRRVPSGGVNSEWFTIHELLLQLNHSPKESFGHKLTKNKVN